MEKPKCRFQADCEQCAMDKREQHSVPKAEQAIEAILGRVLRTTVWNEPVVDARTQQLRQGGEIRLCGDSLQPTERVHVIDLIHFCQDFAHAIDWLLDCLSTR